MILQFTPWNIFMEENKNLEETLPNSGVRNSQKRVYRAVTEESVIFSLYNSLRCEKYVFMGYISKKAMVLPQSSKMSLEVKLVN